MLLTKTYETLVFIDGKVPCDIDTKNLCFSYQTLINAVPVNFYDNACYFKIRVTLLHILFGLTCDHYKPMTSLIGTGSLFHEYYPYNKGVYWLLAYYMSQLNVSGLYIISTVLL